jgi:uncharacterized membrane protein
MFEEQRKMQSTPIEPAGGWPPVTEEDRQQTMMMWIIAIVLSLCGGIGWLSPLIFYITSREKSKFVAFYSAQALLWGLAVFVIVIIGFIFTALLAAIAGPLASLGMVLLIGASIAYLVVLIIGIMKSSAGEWWEMPIVGEYARGMVGLK